MGILQFTVLLILPLNLLQAAQHHCWDFTHSTSPLLDTCGASVSLTASSSSIQCSLSGCSFNSGQVFTSPPPFTLTTSWTIAAWSVFGRHTEQIVTFIVRCEICQSGSTQIFKLGKVGSSIAAKIFTVLHQQNTGLGDSGNGYWVFMFATSDSSQTIFGGYFLTQYIQKVIPTSTDLSTADLFLAGGDGLLNRYPSILLSRLEITDTSYYPFNVPFLDTFLTNAVCLDMRTAPMCNQVHLHYKMTPSYTSAQNVVDSEGSYNAANGIDSLSLLNDAQRVLQGLRFDGNQRVTLISPLPISTVSLTITFWFYPDFGYLSINHSLFSATNLDISLVPTMGATLVSSNSVPVNFLVTPLNNGWNFLSFAYCIISPLKTFSSLSQNGVFSNLEVSIPLPSSISSFTLGSTFYGTMRDFKMYSRFLSKESFSAPATCKNNFLLVSTVCPQGQFYQASSSSCKCKCIFKKECHPLCLHCQDSQNAMCGMCRAPAQLSYSETPGECIICSDNCATCIGRESDQCLTCPSNLFLAAPSPSTCVYSCNDINMDHTFNGTDCSQSIHDVNLQKVLVSSETLEVWLHFSQPLLFKGNPLLIQISQQMMSLSSIQEERFQSNCPAFLAFLQAHQLYAFLSNNRSLILKTYAQIQQPIEFMFWIPIIDSKRTTKLMISKFRDIINTANFIGLMVQGASTTTALILGVNQMILQVLDSISQISSEIFWSIINLNQMLFFLPLSSLHLPKNIFIGLRILRFSIGDLLLIELFFEYLTRNVCTYLQTEPFSQNFSKHDFQSQMLILNSGPLLIILGSILLLQILCLKIKCKLRFQHTLIRLKWGIFYRVILQASLDLTLFSLINLHHGGRQNALQIISFTLSILCLVIFLIFPFTLFRIFSRPYVQLGTFKSSTYLKYGQLYKQQNYESNFVGLHYQIFFLLRRLLICFIIIFVKSNGKLQLLLLSSLSIMQIYILKRKKPFKDECDNLMSLINEVFLLSMYCMFGILQFLSSELVYQALVIGYLIIGLIIFINIVNIVVVLLKKVNDCKSQRRKRKQFKVLVTKVKNRFHSAPNFYVPQKDGSTQDFSHMMCTMNRPNFSKFFHPRNEEYHNSERGPREVEMAFM